MFPELDGLLREIAYELRGSEFPLVIAGPTGSGKSILTNAICDSLEQPHLRIPVKSIVGEQTAEGVDYHRWIIRHIIQWIDRDLLDHKEMDTRKDFPLESQRSELSRRLARIDTCPVVTLEDIPNTPTLSQAAQAIDAIKNLGTFMPQRKLAVLATCSEGFWDLSAEIADIAAKVMRLEALSPSSHEPVIALPALIYGSSAISQAQLVDAITPA